MADDQRRRPAGGGSSRRGVARQKRIHSVSPADDRGGDRPQLHKLRLGLTLAGLLALALVSTVFGMMMAVAQDLPDLESQNEFRAARNSILLDNTGKKRVAVLTGSENRILVRSSEISSNVKRAVIAIEDRRFYTHKGLDYTGIARAIVEDVRRQRAAQGASTITQQFVKNALVAQQNRSLFQKLREAALAYQLERKWSKEKILTEYLNTVYFGEGAYGIESAARVYFGWNHPGCEPNCAEVLEPAEAATLAGLIASPASYSPVQNPAVSLERRNLVLQRMYDQGLITTSELRDAERQSLPPRGEIRTPKKVSRSPYFTSWVEDQLVDRYGSGNTFGGGLEIRTTLDLDFQKAAEEAIAGRLGGIGPSAALVAIDNDTGGVRAMVGGSDFEQRPFNLATQGHRQPGSAFKPFTLVAALEKGISPGRTFSSAPKTLEGPRGPFKVENYEDRYAGVTSLAAATTASDNAVYAEVGYQLVGTRAIARVAKEMGVRTPVSRNPAMVLGGLKQGVTPLEMAKAYETLAEGGQVVSGSLASREGAPVTYTRVKGSGIDDENKTRRKRVISGGDRRAGDADPQHRGDGRYGAGRLHRRVRRRQDRHDGELPGRLVRRLQRRHDRRRVGRVSGGREADGDRVPRRAGRRRHLPGRDLARLHALRQEDPGGALARTRRTRRRCRRYPPPRRPSKEMATATQSRSANAPGRQSGRRRLLPKSLLPRPRPSPHPSPSLNPRPRPGGQPPTPPPGGGGTGGAGGAGTGEP